MSSKFKLSDSFINSYKMKTPPFGFNGLGELVYMRTYSRIKDDGTNEQWHETIERVVNGTYTLQRQWIEEHNLGWNAWKAQRSAQEMYDRMFNMKFLPPGRGLWAMGTTITEERKLFMALNNCAFISTETLDQNFSEPFCFLMDVSMLGVGCGFDTKGAGKVTIKGINTHRAQEVFVIPDTREGWVDSIKLLLESYAHGLGRIRFVYDEIRPAGEFIKGFGGVSSGYVPLEQLHNNITSVLDKIVGGPITMRAIVDIMNMIGKCVVSGNVRRTAEIVFGDAEDDDYLDLKNYDKNPDRSDYGWTSNNSVFAKLGMNYKNIVKRTAKNGEPGFIWMDNVRDYSRLVDSKDFKDKRASGANPCNEQSLESGEVCCLVETFPDKHETLDDFKKTLKYAYLYAKTVTLGKTHWSITNRVMLRNRRIGCSLSGVAQFITHKGLSALKTWSENGYSYIQELDEQYSDFFAIPRSIKTTSIKPSGSISLLAGATAGMHYPESRFYIRRVRLAKTSQLVPMLEKAGYKVELCEDDKANTVVVEIPVDVGVGIKTIADISMWEQLSLAAFLQKYWSDNQVSCTITFDKKEESQIEPALNFFQYQLKGVSFLPKKPTKEYPQMPYETITEEKFNELNKGIKKLKFDNISNEKAETERFCDGDSCIIVKK
jgi:ribonucleoside-triphosphate reductase (thioredoxin)